MYIKILCATLMTGIPQEVVVNQKRQMDLTETPTIQSKAAELVKEMETKIPRELWSQHDTDVGLVKSASPIWIRTNKELNYLGNNSIHCIHYTELL